MVNKVILADEAAECANQVTPAIHRTLTATRRAEVEALAEKLLIERVRGRGERATIEWSFWVAELWLAERDRRREEEKKWATHS